MFRKLLTLELKKVRPKTKYFLVAFVREFGVTDPVQMSVKDLSHKLGVSTSEITKATNLLVENDFFTPGEKSSVRGRPKWCYGCSAKLVEMLEQQQPICSQHHESLVDEIFNSDSTQCKKIDVQSMQTSNKLLLAVMLAYADECGVVRTLGRSDLRKLTGMSDDLLKAQRDKLLDMGFLRSGVAGATNRLLFGAGVGAYFLNMTKIQGEEVSQGILVSSDDLQPYRLVTALYTQMKQYQQNAEWLVHRGLVQEVGMLDEDYKKLVSFFDDKPANGFKRFFALKLNEYASYLLSKHWHNLSEDRLIDDEHLIANIRRDVVPNSKKSCQTDCDIAEEWNTLVTFLYKLALMLAKDLCRKQVSLSKTIAFHKMNHVILPDIQNSGVAAVELHPKGGQKGPMTWCRAGLGEINEADLDHKYLYGLLTRPRK